MSEGIMKISCEFEIPHNKKIKKLVLDTCMFAQLMAAIGEKIQKEDFDSQREESRKRSKAFMDEVIELLNQEKCTLLESAVAIQAIAVALTESVETDDGRPLIQRTENEVTIITKEVE